jgi:2-polyprenyl-3-methyl-5-hydroxy-6-metoxy-1,4-benzoquinol methylase|tara:strand:+ start:2712 stop:3959 length:1248 start_codon:yes stop_codon:yes gene_type:complete
MIKKECRLCKSKRLHKFLDLGNQPPSDQFINLKEIEKPTIYYPLQVYNCLKCGFKQLGFVVDPKILYQKDYPYESSLTASGNKHFNEFAESCTKRFDLKRKDLVIDIGSNVGNLLTHFQKRNVGILGIDPASNICKIANRRKIKTVNSFFNNSICSKILKKFGKAKIITGSNVFAHIDNLDDFFKNIKKILLSKGVLIVEVPYFLNLVKNLEYDTIYHEHLSYITLLPLIKYLKKKSLKIFDVEEKDIHGGSLRIFITKNNNFKTKKRLLDLIKVEKKANLNNLGVLKKFSKKVRNNRFEITSILTNLKKKNKKIVVLSTPAKGMTLLNYCKLDKDFIDFATEKSKLKIKKFTPGTNIQVYSDKEMLRKKPDYALILAWNFKKEIMNNNKKFYEDGGKFIIPIPRVKIISKYGKN